MNISFIGFGNMATAIAQGLAHNKQNQLRASAPSLPIGINKDGIKTHHENVTIIADADVVILAVKPAQMDAVLAHIAESLPSNCLLISIAASLTLSWFSKRTNPNTGIVRAMPNIAAAVGSAATPLIANKVATKQQKQWAEQIFNQIGLTTWVQQESDIDVFTALSGSGPAYVFLFMEAMIKAAIALGLNDKIAEAFTLQTVKGALSLATNSKESLVELRRKVTSPKGTTAAAIDVLSEQGLDKIIFTAMKAAHDRAQQFERM